MKILFTVRALSHFSYIEPIAKELNRKGHSVDLLFDKKWSGRDSDHTVKWFITYHKFVRVGWLSYRKDFWRRIIFLWREIKSYLSYTDRNQSEYYLNRWNGYLPFLIKHIVKIKLIQLILKRINLEGIVPPDTGISSKVRDYDMVIATPCNHRFSEEIEYIKAAKVVGVPTAIVVLSWDNLTTKGLFHVVPDVLLVWNESQLWESVRIHDIPYDKIKIIGAPFFEKWAYMLGRAESRKLFCSRVGMDPERKFFMYAGSSSKIAKDEKWLIEKLHKALPEYQILFRPHPANHRQYFNLNMKDVFVFPQTGALPECWSRQRELYNSIRHCEFVIGINTSAMLDAIIHDKPTIAFITEKYEDTQIKASHFKPLSKAMYLCHCVNDVKILVSDLSDFYGATRREFVKDYIFPEGKLVGENAVNVIESQSKHIGIGKGQLCGKG